MSQLQTLRDRWAGVSIGRFMGTLSLVALATASVCPGEIWAQQQEEESYESDSILFAPDEDEQTTAMPPPELPDSVAAPAAVTDPQGPPASAKPLPDAAAEPVATPPPGPVSSAPSAAPVAASRSAAASSPRLLGTYRVRVAMNQPRFDDGMKFYKKLYGNPKYYPTIAADWFAWDWYATMGLSLRAGYYVADGHASQLANKAAKDFGEDDIAKDKASPTTLTLIPLQVLLTAQGTPFAQKWVVIDGWFGLEHLYFQEVRASSSSSSSAGAMMLADDKSSTDDGALTNKGEKRNMVFGVGANFLLNALDERAIASLRTSLGLGAVYFSPFMEVSRHMSGQSGISFGRTVLGLGFTFESVH